MIGPEEHWDARPVSHTTPSSCTKILIRPRIFEVDRAAISIEGVDARRGQRLPRARSDSPGDSSPQDRAATSNTASCPLENAAFLVSASATPRRATSRRGERALSHTRVCSRAEDPDACFARAEAARWTIACPTPGRGMSLAWLLGARVSGHSLFLQHQPSRRHLVTNPRHTDAISLCEEMAPTGKERASAPPRRVERLNSSHPQSVRYPTRRPTARICCPQHGSTRRANCTGRRLGTGAHPTGLAALTP